MSRSLSVSATLDLQAKYDEATRRAIRILKGSNPLRTIRFGSAAWGPLHEDSDLDLCVVVERINERHIARRQSLIRTHDLIKLLSHCTKFDASFERLRRLAQL